jgi:hypothetical protein
MFLVSNLKSFSQAGRRRFEPRLPLHLVINLEFIPLGTRLKLRTTLMFECQKARSQRVLVHADAPVCAQRPVQDGKMPASFAAANHWPGSPLDAAKFKRIFLWSRPGYFLTIARNVARPVDEPFAVKAYFSYASSARPLSSRTLSHAASISGPG